jgi:hypothetical protein
MKFSRLVCSVAIAVAGLAMTGQTYAGGGHGGHGGHGGGHGGHGGEQLRAGYAQLSERERRQAALDGGPLALAERPPVAGGGRVSDFVSKSQEYFP